MSNTDNDTPKPAESGPLEAGRDVEITYNPETVERMLREHGKKAAENERGEILTLLDQLVEISKIARNSWPEHSEQWFDCNNRYQAYQNAYLRVRARDREE